MNKIVTAVMAIVVSAFLMTNLYLLYSEESVIPKIVHVKEYERVVERDYEQTVMKDSLVAPSETHTVYVDNEDTVEYWYLEEGDEVFLGQELALLNTHRIESERELWASERSGLIDQQTTLENLRSDLESSRRDSDSHTSSDVNRDDKRVAEIEEKTTIELGLNIGFTVDVTQEGSYAQAIAAIDQQLSDITRQLTVLDAQLAQDDDNPALISPASGVISNVMRHGARLAVDIYDEEQVLITYVDEKEWQQLEEGQRVKIQSNALDGVVEGDILSISSVPAKESEQLTTYQSLQKKGEKEPLPYYEVRILPGESIEAVPYASKVTAVITIDEAYAATAIPRGWGRIIEQDRLQVMALEDDGLPLLIEATMPFMVNEKTVITGGLMDGDIVIHEPSLYKLDYTPKIHLSFPTYGPKKEEWKAYGWRNYLKAMLVK